MNINNNPNLSRTRIDCFTQDALTQIKDTLNGDEVTFPNRGGLGTDVRYLSDFALEQIKNAVGNGGGGGQEVVDIDVYYSSDGTTFEKIEPTESDIISYKVTDPSLSGTSVILVVPQSVNSSVDDEWYYTMLTYSITKSQSFDGNLHCIAYSASIGGVVKRVSAELTTNNRLYNIVMSGSSEE